MGNSILNLRDGSIDKTKSVCTDCQAKFSYQRRTSSLNYRMQAKHTARSSSVSTAAVAAAAFTPVTNGRQQSQKTREADWVH